MFVMKIGGKLSTLEMKVVQGGGSFKDLIYAMGGGTAGGAALGAAICAPTVVGSPACSALGAIYGAVAGGFTAGLDSKK